MPYKDPEKQREACRKWKKENPEKARESNRKSSRKWNEENKERKKEYDRKWYEDNKERKMESNRKWKAENAEKVKEHIRKWNAENPEYHSTWKKEKYHTDPCYKLRNLTSCMVRSALKEGKGGESILPYVDWDSYEELKEHIESQFEDWMTWDNHGEWHIDHIKPQSVLLEGVETMDDPKFRECWALENLRPLEARENISKGNKIIDE